MPLVQGLILGASLCCSIGPEFFLVFRQGIRGEAAFLVALLCTVVDFALIAIAIVGAERDRRGFQQQAICASRAAGVLIRVDAVLHVGATACKWTLS